jgi:hypothetical protein
VSDEKDFFKSERCANEVLVRTPWRGMAKEIPSGSFDYAPIIFQIRIIFEALRSG